ncbi:hypothetical protein KO525_03305 [Psychrosphaera sp. B3R10]|uniref:hypothetical protein n=1 Tax=unclassified Psychrosphaera TaxID=2641570 RepID=UPI001C08CD54|nr:MULTISPECIES: hypothetical protein [unclassified Psychrosphaera]MBU2881303.1 hypothetical protein [Psychrosphaera sp. I2R16]MBU2988402.1 hypothetical protein [Psychrosphaera sp. B3R10]
MNNNKVVSSILVSCFLLLTVSCEQQLSEDEYVQKIHENTQSNDYHTALINTKNALQKYPHSEEVRLEAGRFYYQIGYFIQAERFLKPAVSATPRNIDDLDKYFESLLYLNKLKQLKLDLAKTELTDIVKSYKARLMLRQEQHDTATELLSEVKDTSLISFQLALYESKFNFLKQPSPLQKHHRQSPFKLRQNALIYLQNLDTKITQEPRFQLITALILSDVGKHQQALDILTKLNKNRPDLPNIHVYIVQTSLQLENVDLAKQHISLARNAGDKRPIIDQFEAVLAYQNNDFEKSQLLALRALQNGLTSKANRIVAGVSAFRNKRYEIAFNTLSPISEQLSPKDPVLRILTLLELRESKLDNALQYFEKMSLDDISDIKIASYLINNIDPERDPDVIQELQNQLKEKIESSITQKKATLLYTQLAKSYPDENKSTYAKAFRILEKLNDNQLRAEAIKEAKEWDQTTSNSGISATVYALSIWINNQNEKANLLFDALLRTNKKNLIALSFKLQYEFAANNWLNVVTLGKALLTLDKSQSSPLLLMLRSANQLAIEEKNDLLIFVKNLVENSQNTNFELVYIAYLRSNNQWQNLDTFLSEKSNRANWQIFHWQIYIETATRSQDWLLAEQRIKSALELFNNTTELKLLQVQNLIRQQKLKHAKEKLALIDTKSALLPLYYELSGNIDVFEKHYDSAKQHYLQSFELSPHPEILFKLFKLATITQDYDDAIDATTRYFAQAPNEVTLRIDAFNWYASTHPKQALTFVDLPLLQKLIEDNWQLSNNIAWYYHKIGNQTKAKYFIELAIKSQPNNKGVIDTYQKIHFNNETGKP